MKLGISIEPTEDGRRVVVRRRIDAPADEVWDLFVDTEQWPVWGPTLTQVQCPTRFIVAGTSGRIRTVGGVWLPFEITDCSGYRWSWRVGPLPIIGHRVEPDGPDCLAGFEVPLIMAPYVVVCAVALARIARICGAGSP